MRVTVTCFGAMRDYLPPDATGSTSLELSDGATVADVVDALGAPKDLVFAIMVDDERADLSHVLSGGATVTLMPPFTGGALPPPTSSE